jgi:hypothetical protein
MNKDVLCLLRYKKLVLDTGPLLLYLIGLFSQKDLSLFGYDQQQFYHLFQFISGKDVFVTPQVLAEASDLAKNELKSKKFSKFIHQSISPLCSLNEEYVKKDNILKKIKVLSDFGISDTSLICVAEKDILLLTTDFPLYGYCQNNKIPVTHLDGLVGLIMP